MATAQAKPIPISFTRIVSGIADYDKESILIDSIAFSRKIDFRTNPQKWKLQPKTVKESGSTITDLPMWGARVNDDVYQYGDTGNLYKRELNGTTTLVRNVASSHGNGLKYYAEEGMLHYARDKTLGRFGRIGSDPSFVDDFLGAEGGVPTNTAALDLELSSSQYATAADSGSNSITSDLGIEINFKPESLPATGDEMVLASKWLEQSNKRSYKFSVYAVSGYFGDGSDGPLTISSNTTDAPHDANASGNVSEDTMTFTNASASLATAIGKPVLIHQTRGSGAGTWQRNTITAVTGTTSGSIELETPLNTTYGGSGTVCQIIILKQYTDVTISSSFTLTAKAWDGSKGGILKFLATGTLNVPGTISATGKGFRGGTGNRGSSSDYTGQSGEGTAGAAVDGQQSANGNGGGGGTISGGTGKAGGAGGSNGTAGVAGSNGGGGQPGGSPGSLSGSTDLSSLTFGGGGGQGAYFSGNSPTTAGIGGGIVFLVAVNMVVTGSIVSNGTVGGNASSGAGASGGGCGGSILGKCQTGSFGTNLLSCIGGAGGAASFSDAAGGAGGIGRIHVDYYDTISGTSLYPTLDATQDSSLVTNVTYQLRLGISSNGTAEEYLARSLTSLAVDTYSHLAVMWDASTSTAEFYENGASIGTSVGTATAINNNDSLFAIGASFNGSAAAENFIDGKVDDVRLWSVLRTQEQIDANRQYELSGLESGLAAYYKLNSSTSDSAATPDADTLTLVGSPAYTTDVPFSAPTTRLDIDQESTANGQAYVLGTTVDEGNSHRQTFVPERDPQKSIAVDIADKGDSASWTLVVHDAKNRVIATKTVVNADLNLGLFEFVFDDVWRPILGASYHFHVYASNTTGAPAVTTSSTNDLETVVYKSYYQFLVDDIYHPQETIVNALATGNERYLAVWDGSSYNPHRLKFPSGWRVRSIAKWREYAAIGCWTGDLSDPGIIFFWNGYSTTYNFFVEIPEGGINAMFGANGTLQIVAGNQGDVLEYTDGDRAIKVKRLPKMTPDKEIEILPGAMTMWQTLLQIGAGVSDSEEFERGVYSYGRINRTFPDALSYDHTASSGGDTTNTAMKIGMLMPVDGKLLIGFKYGAGNFGTDVVDPAGDVYSSGSIEWLIRDEAAIWKEKKPDTIRADFYDLIEGQSVGIQYKLDRGEWSDDDIAEFEADPQENENIIKRVQPNIEDSGRQVRHREYQVRLNLYTEVATSPEALGVTIMEDALTDEQFV